MIPNAIEGTTRRIGKSQGYLGLCVRDAQTQDGTPVMQTSWQTSWQPTPAELERIACGAPIILTILGTGHPPVMLDVGALPE